MRGPTIILNIFGIPANVPRPTLFGWPTTHCHCHCRRLLQDDIRNGFDIVREGYPPTLRDAFPYATLWKFVFSVATIPTSTAIH